MELPPPVAVKPHTGYRLSPVEGLSFDVIRCCSSIPDVVHFFDVSPESKTTPILSG